MSTALFDAVAADLGAVREAYGKAGLLAEAGPGSLGWTLFGGADGADRFRRQVLLADALLRNRVAGLVYRRASRRHVVVFGGNNVGKSTVVNVLAAALIAGTSPEGGHTRHAQAFSADGTELFGWNPHAFAGFRRVPARDLPQAGFDAYAVTPVESPALPRDVALWDSPDCDSVGSARYLAGVIEAASIADLVVYVTSVEKYAVNDLVEWLFDLSEAGIPILGCLNKTSRRDRPVVLRKQEQDILPAVAQRLGRPVPQIRMLALRTMTEGEEADLWSDAHAEATELRAAAFAAVAMVDEPARSRQALRMVDGRIGAVLGPARGELRVRAAWVEAVGNAVGAFVGTYEDEYLTSDSVIEPFTKLNVQLLELLNPNIPGLTDVMRALRRIRQLPLEVLRIGWRLVADRGAAAKEAALAPELRAYAHAHRALLRAVHDTIAAERAHSAHHVFWDRLAAAWEERAVALAEAFRRAAERHMEQTDAEIRSAAADILRALEQRPTVLRALRTVRLSTELGGLAVSFVLPGHGSLGHDLLIAPLVMGATGAAADYAVEGYVSQRRARIVEKLRTDARAIATQLYAEPLHALGTEVMAAIGAIGVPAALLDRLEDNLRRLGDAA